MVTGPYWTTLKITEKSLKREGPNFLPHLGVENLTGFQLQGAGYVPLTPA